VFGLTDIALSVLVPSIRKTEDLVGDLVDIVDIKSIRKAINTNDVKLALKNFRVIQPFLMKHLPATGFVLTPALFEKFVDWTSEVQRKGLPTLFPQDPMESWTQGKQLEFPKYLTEL
jgi:hypothetical protein